jgi:hypothetical protein
MKHRQKIDRYLTAMGSSVGLAFDQVYVDPASARSYPALGGLAFDGEVKGGGNGSVGWEVLEAAFFGQGGIFATTPFSDGDKPLFAVIDHNSAHHISYVLARHAFARHGDSSRKNLVLSYDAHNDWTDPKARPTDIKCSTWGGFLFHPGIVWSAELYAVVGLGTATPSGTFEWAAYEPAARTQPTRKGKAPTSGGTKVDAMIAAILGPEPDCSQWNVYITLDRDLMQGSCTPYKDGAHLAAHTRACVEGCYAALNNGGAKIVGFDVIGLPCSFSPRSMTKVVGTDEGFVNQAFEDIKICYRLMQ